MSSSEVKIYTDGACSGNPGPGGWAALICYEGVEKVLSGVDPHTTNNRMEMMAAIKGLEFSQCPITVVLYTDSRYLQQGMISWMVQWKKNGWRGSNRKPVKNVDLWQRLDQLASRHKITWQWVKAHSGHRENEMVNDIAQEISRAQKCRDL